VGRSNKAQHDKRSMVGRKGRTVIGIAAPPLLKLACHNRIWHSLHAKRTLCVCGLTPDTVPNSRHFDSRVIGRIAGTALAVANWIGCLPPSGSQHHSQSQSSTRAACTL